MPWPFTALCIYFPITVGKQGWASNWIEAFQSFDLVLSKISEIETYTSRPLSAEITSVERNCLNSPSVAKSSFRGDIFTPSDFMFQKDMFPSLSEWCPHLFQFWASAHQPPSISISRLEIYLASRQVLFGGLMTTDLWILSSISIIGGRVIAGGCSHHYNPQQSLKAS